MKAERRHELQTNSLAQFISDLPLYLRFHANKILFGVILVCLVILLIRHRMNSAAAAREATHNSLAAAHTGIDQLKVSDRMQSNDTARSQERRKLSVQVNTAIDQIMDNTKDPQDSAIRAEALIARGDLNWTLANLPSIAGAATQPQLAMPQNPSQYLDNAAGAYQQVLNQYPKESVAKATALLGLAAIEENRGNWDKAIDYYNQVTTDPTMANSFKEIARQRLALVPQLRAPVYLGTYSATQPSTQPGAPSTAPAAAIAPSPAGPPSPTTTLSPTTQPQ